MVKISATLVKNHRNVKNIVYSNVNEYESQMFYTCLVEICRRLDISTPIVIDYYKNSYEEFNFVKFTASDFVDKINFDYLLLENIDR